MGFVGKKEEMRLASTEEDTIWGKGGSNSGIA